MSQELKDLLSSAGLKQKDYADMVGVTPKAISESISRGVSPEREMAIRYAALNHSGELDRLIEIKACPIRGRVYEAISAAH